MKEQIIAKLPKDHPWAKNICWFNTIPSTNTDAKQMAQNGASHGTVLIADQQTLGRGRMGRSFSSPGGQGIYMSVILRPGCSAAELMHLTCAVGVAMCDAVEQASGFRPRIKWINDLIAKGKKLGGILTELSLVPGTDQVDFAVVGIGINCLQEKQQFPPEIRDIAISLKTATQKHIDRAQLAAAMVDALYNMSEKLLREKSSLMAQYTKDCCTLGQDIYLIRGDQQIPCRALALDSDGALVVEYADGSVETVSSGEVSVRPL